MYTIYVHFYVPAYDEPSYIKNFSFACCFACRFSTLFGQQFVRLQQNKLVDSTGKTIQLNAVNFGGWLLWECWVWGGGFNKESDIKNRLQQLLGEGDYQKFPESYYHSFVTEKDIAQIAQCGFNCIRLPVNYRLFDTANRKLYSEWKREKCSGALIR